MEQITDTDPNSNEFFFITDLSDNTLKAGKNSFVVNCTPKIFEGQELGVKAYDSTGNQLSVTEIESNASGIETTEFREVYIINVPATTKVGIGSLEIKGVGIDVGIYTGSFAYFRGKAYPISETQRLPLVQAPPGVEAFPEVEVVWRRNLLIDTAQQTDTRVRFFDFPKITANPQIYISPDYPVGSYRLASGSCSGVAAFPRNNASRNFDYIKDKPLYELYFSGGTKFSGSMVGENIRIKNPFIKSFTYANYSNNQINFSGVLNTDFIAKIERVVNDTTLLIDIPFATVSDLVNRANEDSPYNRNNLVDPLGYTISDDPQKQTTYQKKNFYVLSIGNAEYEIFHKEISTQLPQSVVSSSLIVSGSNTMKKLVVEIEFNHLRALCGTVDSYKIYGNSLNSPESRTMLVEGKVVADEAMVSNNFNSGLYNKMGAFFDQAHADRFWLVSGSGVTFRQTNERLINGMYVAHSDNSSQTEYIILKDDNSGAARTPQYVLPHFATESYWYATSNAFLNAAAHPTASYNYSIANIPQVQEQTGSQEISLMNSAHDSNPIKLRRSTLYQFSMLVQPSIGNTAASKLFVYFVSGTDRRQIGLIDNTFKSITDEYYTNTFFSSITQFGTIILVPVAGSWNISTVSIKPYHAVDYSPDSFKVKIPFSNFAKNELFEIEAELYDRSGRMAYGVGSYNFNYNKMYTPLTAQFFADPLGIISTGYNVIAGGGGGGGGGGDLILDGGNAFTTVFNPLP